MRRTAVEIVRDYAYMHGHPFTYKIAMGDLGLPRRSVMRAMKALRASGEIVLISDPKAGIYRWASDRQKKASQERREAERRERGKAVLITKGEQWHKRLLAL